MSDIADEIAEKFIYRRRTCVIVKLVNVPLRVAPNGVCYNGYVSVIPRSRRDYLAKLWAFTDRIKTVELTYFGVLGHLPNSDIPKSLWFLGFDTTHIWNSEHPITQTLGHVKRQTMKLADEMIRKRI